LLNDIEDEFSGGVHNHPTLGKIDQYHLPLATLKQYFPDVFKRVESYHSYALLRNPFERFPSSVAQRIKQYREMPLHRISPGELAQEVESIIRRLSSCEENLDPDYAHFSRQSDYVEIDGEPVVDYLFAAADVDIMLSEIAKLVGQELSLEEPGPSVNQADVYRRESLRQVFEAVRPLVAGTPLKLVPRWLQHYIRQIIYTPAKERMPPIFQSARITDFVSEYYCRDIELFNHLQAGKERRFKQHGGS
jgi:hypothetical protein